MIGPRNFQAFLSYLFFSLVNFSFQSGGDPCQVIVIERIWKMRSEKWKEVAGIWINRAIAQRKK